jgi:hypothetical protein
MYGRRVRCMQGFGGDTCPKMPFGRPSITWKNNIKMDFK